MAERGILILCGGRSRRLGRDKRLIDGGGEPLLERVAAQLQALGLPMMAALASEDDVARLPTGVARWWDRHPGRGPLPNLLAALERWGGELLLCPGDRLLPDAEILRRLLSEADAHPSALAVGYGVEGSLDPMHTLYRAAMVGGLRQAWEGGRESLRDLLSSLRPEQRWVLELERPGIDLNSTREITAMRVVAKGPV